MTEAAVVRGAMDTAPERAAALEGEFGERTIARLKRQKLWNALSGHERALLDAGLASWTEENVADMWWGREAHAALLWTIGAIDELGDYDAEFVERPSVLRAEGDRDTAEFISKAVLRDASAIRAARDVAQLWHWRSRTTQLMRNPELLRGRRAAEWDFVEIVRDEAQSAFASGDLPAPIDDDFPAFDKPYRDLSDEEYEVVTSIAVARHYALNWVCGYARNWDEVPTET
jgi:hypothetical protein